MEGPLMATTCSKFSLEWRSSSKMMPIESLEGEDEDGILHLSFGNDLRELGDEEARTKKQTLGWNSPLTLLMKVARKGKKEENSSLCRY